MPTHKPLIHYKIILALALVLCTTRIGLGTMFSGASDITPQSLLDAVNKQRVSRNIAPLNTNSKLSRAADIKANDMIQRKYFSHIDPDGHYVWDTIIAQGYKPYTILGENLAINFSDTDGLVSAWIDSPTHRQNMLNSAFQDQGMGVHFGETQNGEYSVAVANTFGTLVSSSTSKDSSNKDASVAKNPPVKSSNPKPSTSTKSGSSKPGTTTPSKNPTTPPVAVNPEQVVTISISNSEKEINQKTISIFGTAPQNSKVEIQNLASDSDGKLLSNEVKTTTADTNNNYVLKFENLVNAQHTFIASTVVNNKKIQAAPYKTTVSYTAPEIKINSFTIEPQETKDTLLIHVTGAVSGENVQVDATMLDKTTSLKLTDGLYSGDLQFDKHQNLQNQSVTISAQDDSGFKKQANFPIRSLGNTAQDYRAPQSAPDLYDIFKYIVLGFGGLFLLFVISDLIISRKNQTDVLDGLNHTHIVLLFLITGTLLVVNWWH